MMPFRLSTVGLALVGLFALPSPAQPPAERREPLFPVMVAASCLPLLLTAVVQDAVVLCVLWAVAGIGNALQLVANRPETDGRPLPHGRQIRCRGGVHRR